jgi:hypothetical protein
MHRHKDKQPTNNSSLANANNISRAALSGAPVQRVLMRNPEGTRNRFGMDRGIRAGDNFVADDFMWETGTRSWYRYKKTKSANEIFVVSDAGGPVLLYNMVSAAYQDVDVTLHAGIAAKMQEVNNGGTADTGVHYPFNYRANYAARWQEDYANGYANAAYFQRTAAPSTWDLRPGQRASQAIQAWLTGLTIAECASTLVAIQLDGARRTLGDAEFDRRFGPAAADVAPTVQRLHISGDISECLPEGWLTGAGTDENGGPILAVGAKYFFGNHSAYNRKHPDGFFQGENCVHMGNGQWSGFGVENHTTAEMYALMRDQYNLARTEGDYRLILTNDDYHNIPAQTMEGERAKGMTYAQIYAAHTENINPHLFAGSETLPNTITVQDLRNDDEAGITSQGIKLDVRTMLGI